MARRRAEVECRIEWQPGVLTDGTGGGLAAPACSRALPGRLGRAGYARARQGVFLPVPGRREQSPPPPGPRGPATARKVTEQPGGAPFWLWVGWMLAGALLGLFYGAGWLEALERGRAALAPGLLCVLSLGVLLVAGTGLRRGRRWARLAIAMAALALAVGSLAALWVRAWWGAAGWLESLLALAMAFALATLFWARPRGRPTGPTRPRRQH